MKNLIKIFVLIMIFVSYTNYGLAQNTSDTKSNQANAQVLSQISLTKGTPLEFGSFTHTGGGSVTIGTDGSRSSLLNVVVVAGSVTPTAASYSVTGTKYAAYTITIPVNGTVKVKNATDYTTMDVAMNYSGPGTHHFDSSGVDSFTVGGTLTVNADQTPGIYTTDFNVTVAY